MRRVAFLFAAAMVAIGIPTDASAREWPTWLAPCEGGRLCGTFPVPLDRAHPEGPTIGLHVVVSPASREAERAPEALVAVAGGPGGASTELAHWATSTFLVAAGTRDILLVDQRGTGRSQPLNCPSPQLVTPRSSAQDVRAYWAACLGKLAVDPRLLTTAVAADDLDDVRAALGYPRIDLYGGSYGATVVQYYLLRHGEHARTVTLDAGTLLDVPIFERWAATNQRMLDRLFARCAAQRACRQAFPSPTRDLRTILARLDRAPVRYRGVTIRRDDFANAVQYLSRSPETAAELPLLLRRAARDGVAAIVPSVQERLPQGGPAQLMSAAIRCFEPWARYDPAETARLGAGTYLGPTMVREARTAAAVCSTMPPFTDVPGADRAVASDVPALVLVGGQDPQDPLENVAAVTRTMPAARIVVVRGAGHGAINHGCAEALANELVRAGTAADLDTRCAAKAPLTPFVLPG
jgi:pimeloyl-ACP methyl ester carboxylesterase